MIVSVEDILLKLRMARDVDLPNAVMGNII